MTKRNPATTEPPTLSEFDLYVLAAVACHPTPEVPLDNISTLPGQSRHSMALIVNRLVSLSIIDPVPGTPAKVTITERGTVLLAALKATPLPVQSWRML